MSTELPGTPRAGKYCPRCHAMTQREEAVCRQCGHRFRTGTDARQAGPDPLNRTMQFVLPPLPPRSAAPSAPPRLALAFRRRLTAAALILPAACLAWLWWHSRRAAGVFQASPVGVWETTLHGKASANARLEFEFDAGGTGRFSWRESGPHAPAGQTPLHWRQNADGTLALALTPPSGGDPVSQALTGIFSRPAWTWRVDRAQRRLVLGTLAFTEET